MGLTRGVSPGRPHLEDDVVHRGVGLLEVTSEELRASVLAIALW